MRIQSAGMIAGLCLALWAQRPADVPLTFTQILGRPTGHSITVSVLSLTDMDAYFEYGVKPAGYAAKTTQKHLKF